jgi:hypothetical protein
MYTDLEREREIEGCSDRKVKEFRYWKKEVSFASLLGIYKSNIGWKEFEKYEVPSLVRFYCGLDVSRE